MLPDTEGDEDRVGGGPVLQPHHCGLIDPHVRTALCRLQEILCDQLLHLLHGPVGQLDETTLAEVGGMAGSARSIAARSPSGTRQ